MLVRIVQVWGMEWYKSALLVWLKRIVQGSLDLGGRDWVNTQKRKMFSVSKSWFFPLLALLSLFFSLGDIAGHNPCKNITKLVTSKGMTSNIFLFVHAQIC